MKKIFIINILAVLALGLVFICSQEIKKSCSTKCCSQKKNIEPKESSLQGGSDADDQIFQFNRMYIKM